MTSSPITLWQIDGERMETVTKFIFLGSKITEDFDYSHEIKRPLKENCEKTTQNIKKQRHHFADKSPYNQSYGFFSSLLWMWMLDNKDDWASKNWCFWTVLGKLLRVPWAARRSNQWVLKEINPQHSLEGLMLNPKLQYFGYLMGRVLEKTLMLGKLEARRIWGR